MNVNEAMSTPVKTCHAHTSLDEVARLMWDGNCGAVPVIGDDGQPIGMVTDRDIAMAAMLNHQPLWNIPASTVIQQQHPVCCNQREPVESCVAKMEENGVRRILVTDDSGALCGIVSMGDAVALAGADKARTRNGALGAGQVLGMLKKVSAHHVSGNHALTTL